MALCCIEIDPIIKPSFCFNSNENEQPPYNRDFGRPPPKLIGAFAFNL